MIGTIVLVAIVTAGIPPFASGSASFNGGVNVPWFGSNDMDQGWHLRVPISVNNTGKTPMINATAGYDIKLADLLVAAGWPARADQPDRPAWFSFDPTSARVVEYRALGTGGPLDGVLVGPVPTRVYLGAFNDRRAYDPDTQPDVHVDFMLPGVFNPNSTRYFYVYLDTVSNGPKSTNALPSDSLLDARYWMGRGTTLYGRATQVVVYATEDNTTVSFDVYDKTGRPRPSSAGDVELEGGQQRVLSVSTTNTLVRLHANHAVLAVGEAGTVVGPMMSLDGGALGTQFSLPADSPAYTVIRPTGSSTITVDGKGTQTLDSGTPLYVFTTQSRPHFVTASDPVLVLAWPDQVNAPPMVSENGTPLGTRLIGQPYAGQLAMGGRFHQTPQPPCIPPLDLQLTPGYTTLYTPDGNAPFRGASLLSDKLAYPQIGGRLAPQPGTLTMDPTSISTSPPQGCPLQFYATATATTDDPTTASSPRLGGFGGAPQAPMAGALGMDRATSATIAWPMTAIALYNGTTLQETSPSGVSRESLEEGQALDMDASDATHVALQSDKPILLVGRGEGAFFAGLDSTPLVKAIGGLEFRGYLVDLEPGSGSAVPMIQVGAPGRATTFTFAVRNLARDALGRGAPDTIQLATDPVPPGWTANLSTSKLSLTGGSSQAVTLSVTPPPDADADSRLTLTIHAVSAGNPNVTAALQTITILRTAYGVGLWFDHENGPEQETFTLDRGANTSFSIAVKNLATVPDGFVLSASILSPGWGVSFKEAASALDDVDLQEGASKTIELSLTAPAGGSSQGLLIITATSNADASVTKQITATVRTRADLKISLTVENTTIDALPGERATFHFTLHNRGNDGLSASWIVQGELPSGWGPTQTYVRGFPVSDISGVAGGTDVPIDLVVPVASNATRAELVSLDLAVQTVPQFSGDAVLTDAQAVQVLVAPYHALSLVGGDEPLTVDARGIADARVRVENGGNGEENITVEPTTLPLGTSVLAPNVVLVPRNGSAVVNATLSLPTSTPAGRYPTMFELVTEDGTRVPWAFNVTVPVLAKVSLVASTPTESIAGQSGSARFEIDNTGNVPLDLPPRLTALAGWDLAWNVSVRTLAPGASEEADLIVTTPRGTADGATTLAVDPAWATADGIPWSVRSVALDANASVADGAVVVRVANSGTGDAANVDVSLYQGDRRVDEFVIPRVAPHGTAQALLGLPAGASNLQVRVDGPGQYGPPIAIALHPTTHASPGAGIGLLVLAVAATAMAANRRR